MLKLISLIMEFIPKRRKEIGKGKTDHFEVWLGASVDGRAYSDEEIANLVMTMIIGGSDTVPLTVANTLLLLEENPKAKGDIKKKLDLTFLLKDLFKKDKLLNVYSEELANILKAIDPDEIPESYRELVKQNLDQNLITTKQIKFDNEILHRSKVLKHFLDNNKKISKNG